MRSSVGDRFEIVPPHVTPHVDGRGTGRNVRSNSTHRHGDVRRLATRSRSKFIVSRTARVRDVFTPASVGGTNERSALKSNGTQPGSSSRPIREVSHQPPQAFPDRPNQPVFPLSSPPASHMPLGFDQARPFQDPQLPIFSSAGLLAEAIYRCQYRGGCEMRQGGASKR